MEVSPLSFTVSLFFLSFKLLLSELPLTYSKFFFNGKSFFFFFLTLKFELMSIRTKIFVSNLDLKTNLTPVR